MRPAAMSAAGCNLLRPFHLRLGIGGTGDLTEFGIGGLGDLGKFGIGSTGDATQGGIRGLFGG
jgi:hypothetical protein